MQILNIVTSPRKEKSASTAIINTFLAEYGERVRDVTLEGRAPWVAVHDARPCGLHREGAGQPSLDPLCGRKGPSPDPASEVGCLTASPMRDLSRSFARLPYAPRRTVAPFGAQRM
jgi:hypothetical protein